MSKTYQRRPVVVQDIVRDAVEAFGPLLESQDAAVRIQAPAAPLVIGGDEDALKQALMNLIDNAIKYSPHDKNVNIDVLEREKDVEIRICDHGIGIAPDDQAADFREDSSVRAEAGRPSVPRGRAGPQDRQAHRRGPCGERFSWRAKSAAAASSA